MIQTVTHSAAETEQFAEHLAARLRAGDVLFFTGGLGAGKTAFVRGLAKGLHTTSEVSSPTFALVHEYKGDIPLYHFDMYRVSGLEDLYSTGYFDYLEENGIVAVEWSENIADYLPAQAIQIDIRQLGENDREITLSGNERFD